MRDLYIVGAGGFGRELLSWLRGHPACGQLWEPRGFVDDNPGALAGFGLDLPVVGGVGEIEPRAEDLFVCGLGRPATKRAMVDVLLKRGAEFLTFVHPSAVVGERVRLGRGTVLCPGVILTCDLHIGEFALFNCGASAGHDVMVKDFCTISGHVDLTSRTVLEPGVFVGSQAVVIPGVKVGEGAVIGAGAVVIQNVRPRTTVFGNPARPLVS